MITNLFKTKYIHNQIINFTKSTKFLKYQPIYNFSNTNEEI